MTCAAKVFTTENTEETVTDSPVFSVPSVVKNSIRSVRELQSSGINSAVARRSQMLRA